MDKAQKATGIYISEISVEVLMNLKNQNVWLRLSLKQLNCLTT
jgi:hypothetical protein